MQSTFQQHIITKIEPLLMQELGLKNVMQLPKIRKIIVSISHKNMLKTKKFIDEVKNDLLAITGQYPVVTHAKKSVATFKLRAGMPIGCKVTLRRFAMYEFLHRLINIVFPRVRDFRGLKLQSFDQFGNYNFGFREEIVFPEIDYDKITINKGMNVTLVMQHCHPSHSQLLLRKIGFPLRK